MRIILIQSEIEIALRQYVLGQINIAEGQDISIDFKNTRGDDGATAEINITKPVSESPNVRAASQTATQSRQPAAATKTATATVPAATAPSVAATAPSTSVAEPTVEPVSETEVEQSATDVTEADVAAAETAMATLPVTKPVVSEAPPAGKSLFANLTKPVNPKPDAQG